MTISIFLSATDSVPAQILEHPGSVLSFIEASAKKKIDVSEPQPVAVFKNGLELPAKEWAETACENVEIRVVQHGFEPLTWAIIAVAALASASLLFRPNIPGQRQQAQGRAIVAAEGSANAAKPNSVVPELFGTHLRYPDYLTPPRLHFASPRVQYLETLLCIGPGEYEILSKKIGNTDIANIDGAEVFFYPPGADVSVNGLHQNWYSAKEVGSTSAGTAGLELGSEVISDSLPTASTYAFSGNAITADANWPNGWGNGTQVQIYMRLPYVATNTGTYSEFKGKFTHIQPLSVGGDLYCTIGSGPTRKLRVNTIGPSGSDYVATFLVENEGVYTPFVVPDGSLTAVFNSDSALYTVSTITGNVATFVSLPGWFGFPSVSLSSADATFEMRNSLLYGDWTGPFFAMPTGETSTEFEYDLFFPQGLCEISGGDSVGERGVRVQVQYRREGSPTWTSFDKVYVNASLDQLGFTERLSLPQGRYEFRHRRTSAASTSTAVKDTVQLYGLRSLLKSPLRYLGWSTMGVRVKGLGKIGSNAENQINVLATRKLPTLDSAVAVPTRDISAAMKYIAQTVGFDRFDEDALADLHALWTSRGETLDNVFGQTTVRGALHVAAMAGMGDITMSDGLLTPVREGIRTQKTKSYSKQNTTGPIRRTFRSPRPDDNDGVRVEFTSADDNYATISVDCILPGKIGLKLETLKLEGVTDRTRAWRTGMRRAREQAYIRWSYEFGTEMDAFCNNYLDLIEIIPDIPEYGSSAMARSARRTADGIEIVITESVKDGADFVAWRDTRGNMVGPFQMTKVSRNVVIAVAPDAVALPYTGPKMEPSHVYMGTMSKLSFPALVDRMQPTEKTANIQAVNYDARKYADDDNFPPGA